MVNKWMCKERGSKFIYSLFYWHCSTSMNVVKCTGLVSLTGWHAFSCFIIYFPWLLTVDTGMGQHAWDMHLRSHVSTETWNRLKTKWVPVRRLWFGSPTSPIHQHGLGILWNLQAVALWFPYLPFATRSPVVAFVVWLADVIQTVMQWLKSCIPKIMLRARTSKLCN